ncbi:hypothetical protein Peur_032090 [Populus x canadensis]
MIVRRGGVDFLRFFPLSCFSAVYSSHILSDSIAMIVGRGGVDFVRFFLLSCFSAAYSSHILSDSIHNMVLLGENSIVDMDMGMSACLLLSCLKRVLICKDINRLCGGTTPWKPQAGFLMSLSANHFWCVAIVIIWFKTRASDLFLPFHCC